MAYVHAIIYDSGVHLLTFEDGKMEFLEPLSWHKSVDHLFSLIDECIPLEEINTIFFATNTILFDSQQFREECRECCEDNDISYYFVPEYYLLPSLSLTFVKPFLKKGEKVAVFSVITRASVNSEIFYFVFEYDGQRYQFYEDGILRFPINAKEMIKELKDTPGLKRVIINKLNVNEKVETLLAQCLRSQFKLDVIEVESHPEYFKGSKLAQHLNAKVIIPRYPDLKDYQPFTVEINQPDRKVLFKAEDYISLPFEKSVCFVVENEKSVVLKCGSTFKIIEELNIAQFKGRKIKVTLDFDIDSIYLFTTTVVEESPVKVLPIEGVTKPMIVFTPDTFLVLLNNHTALKDSNGKYRIPLYISFAKKKVEFGHEAVKATETDPTFVVNDILKFCLDDGDVSSKVNRNFTVSKDDEGKTLLEFDTFEGRRRANLPFLIALLLKHTLKMIKAETKKTPSELDIAFKDIKITNNLMIIFLEAAGLLKIKLSFV